MLGEKQGRGGTSSVGAEETARVAHVKCQAKMAPTQIPSLGECWRKLS